MQEKLPWAQFTQNLFYVTPHDIWYVNFTRISFSHEIQVKGTNEIHIKKFMWNFAWKFPYKFHYKCSFHTNIFTWISHAPLRPMNKWLGKTYNYCCWSRIAVCERAQGQIRHTTTVVEVESLYASVHKSKKAYHYCCWSRIAVRERAQGQIRLTTTVVEVESLYASVHKVKWVLLGKFL